MLPAVRLTSRVFTPLSVNWYVAGLLLLLAGVMKSRSTQTLRIDSVDHRVSVEQTITYNECPHHRVAAADSVRIAVSRNFFTYSDQENIVRYSQTNRVPGTGAPLSYPSNDWFTAK